MIDAIRWTGTNINEACLFIQIEGLPADGVHIRPGLGYTPVIGTLSIPTLEGVMTASPGDMIIRGVNGEFYPCKPDIFEKTYEEIVEQREGDPA